MAIRGLILREKIGGSNVPSIDLKKKKFYMECFIVVSFDSERKQRKENTRN